MLWLAVHMWALLFAAFGVGLIVGWWIWGQRDRPLPPQPALDDDTPMGTLELDDAPQASAGDRT